MADIFLRRVAQTISEHHLLPPAPGEGAPVLVALSGGADSVALLRCLPELGYTCEAAHCNFHLRGEESDRDEAFVGSLCKKLGVKLHKADFQTADYARQHGVSIEMAAREQRYAFFRNLMALGKYAAVAVAHHRDDNAETILLNIVRGTGLQGLAGMAYKRGDIVRPLLDVSRQEILDYLHEIGQEFITDSTNLTPDVKRNFIRLRVIPLLRELNPAIKDTLLQNAAIAREAQSFLSRQTNNINKVKLPDGSTAIRKKDIGDHILLFGLLHPLGFTPAQIADIWKNFHAQPGAVFRSGTHELLRDRNQIIIRKSDAKSECPSIFFAPGECATLMGQSVSSRIVAAGDIRCISRNPDMAYLDADKISGNLILRTLRRGDRFTPFGAKGSKLVSRYMIDRKFTAFQKERQLVLTDSTDILWLVGQRPDDLHKIVSGQTKNVLIVEIRLSDTDFFS